MKRPKKILIVEPISASQKWVLSCKCKILLRREFIEESQTGEFGGSFEVNKRRRMKNESNGRLVTGILWRM